MNHLADAIASLRQHMALRIGTVTATRTGYITVDLGDDTTIPDIPTMRGQGTWATGDRAAILIDKHRTLALGAIVPGNPGPLPPATDNPDEAPEPADFDPATNNADKES